MGILGKISGIFSGGTVEKAQSARRKFDAAAINRFTAGWMAEQNSIDNELKGDLDRLRARSRDLANNNDYVRKYLQMVVANLVGPQGFMLQARVEDKPGQQDKLANDAIERAWYDWSEKAEITGRMGFVDLCRAMAEGLARDGEILLRKVRGASADNPYGFALQLLDIDRLDTGYNLAAAAGRNAVIMGIEVDDYSRPVAYHLFSAHPNGNAIRQRQRIPSDEIIHRYIVRRPEQTRGYPWAHAVIRSLHDLNEYNKSALIAARKGADTLGFFVSPNGEPPSMDADENGEPISVSVPGQYDTLPEGYDFKPYDSQYPSATYGDFVKAILRRISTGLGVSYNTLAEDLEGVNFSSIRSGVLTERDQWMTLQNWMIGAILKPIYLEWLGLALLNGAIRMPNGSALPLAKLDKFSAHAWQGRRWQWVDPLKDIEAARLAIQSGVSSPQTIAAQMGVDVDDVLTEIARFEAAVEAAGLASVSYKKEQTAPAAVVNQEDAAASKAMSSLAEQMRSMEQRVSTSAAAPVIHVTVAPPEVRNEFNMPEQAAPVVNVQPPEVRVDVAAPSVTVAAPEVRVDVAAPEVNVEAVMPEQKAPIVQVELPKRKTETLIERDPQGNIARATQIETTIEG